MKLVEINFKPDQKELITFGRTMIIGFSILALVALFIFDAPRVAIGFTIFGIVSFILSRFGKAAMVVYIPWMGFGLIMGTIISNLILAFLYFIIITPIALFFKMIKRDLLHKSFDLQASSYWHNSTSHEYTSITDYERQF